MSPITEPDLKVVGLNSSEKDGLSAAERPANCRGSDVPILLSSLLLKQWPSSIPEVAAFQQDKND